MSRMFFKKVLLLSLISTILPFSLANNFYIGAAYSPVHYESWSFLPPHSSSTNIWFPFSVQTHIGGDLQFLFLPEEDPEWGHADFGGGARAFLSATATNESNGNTEVIMGLEPYLYLIPSSQLGLKLYTGFGLASDTLTNTGAYNFYGAAFNLDEALELFFDIKHRQNDIADASSSSTTYNLGINLKF